MATKELIDPNLLRKLLRYDAETGKLFWLERGHCKRDSWNSQYAGKEAFCTSAHHGYKRGKVLDVAYAAHRVAWALHYGEWPDGLIDHINGRKDDNRIKNLRVVTAKGNSRNRKSYRSLPVGIRKRKRRRPYEASINVTEDGRSRGIYIGSYFTLEEAVTARRAAQEAYGFYPEHGDMANPSDTAG